ncbi:hypothetical protein GCM10009733_068530 [Nonomuraea maheshkhaliensis]|uniref:Uncharacterized protein n=1 Tax=Nonomuraea maheshkhaliensis TaxID=419590 RepID=A0ABP4RV47_9ACTN
MKSFMSCDSARPRLTRHTGSRRRSAQPRSTKPRSAEPRSAEPRSTKPRSAEPITIPDARRLLGGRHPSPGPPTCGQARRPCGQRLTGAAGYPRFSLAPYE